MDFHSLKREVNQPSTSVIFLNMVISIKNNCITTKMYEKTLNLYLYISPFSAHPPGVLTGLIIGNILRIHHLCSKESDCREFFTKFYQQLRAQGYLPSQLDPLFLRGFELTKTAQMPTTKNKQTERRRSQQSTTDSNNNDNVVILHLPYHPKTPPSSTIQQSFKNNFMWDDEDVAGVTRLTIAYSRPKNLGEKLSYRKIDSFCGPPVSSYL